MWSHFFWDILVCFREKYNVFFSTFCGVSSCEFDQKNRFLKNEKNFVKNVKKRPFFCPFEGGKVFVSTPRFWRTPFWPLLQGKWSKSGGLKNWDQRVPPLRPNILDPFFTPFRRAFFKSLRFQKKWICAFSNLGVRETKSGRFFPLGAFSSNKIMG